MVETTASYGIWEIAVLSLLRERSMHPYEIQRLLKARHKDEVLVLKKGSLYHAIARLEKNALIAPYKVSREGLRPERTTYRITKLGESSLLEWLQNFISVPQQEKSAFMGAVSFIFHLRPKEALRALDRRIESLVAELSQLETTLKEAMPRVGRIHLIESEYAQAMRRSELAWVRTFARNVRDGTLKWEFSAIVRDARESEARLRKSSRR